MNSSIKIEMLSTGDEVLYGQITDTNAAWLSDFLFQEGFFITSRFTVGDDLVQLVDTLQQRTKINDVLIVNGGLGPTSDDLSAEAAAKANNEDLVLHQEWVDVMANYFASRGRPMAQANIKQAMLPKSATIVDNPVGTACGFRMVINNCIVFFTPGVPSEFKEMVKSQILPDIQKHYPSINKPLCYRLTTMGRSESDLASEIDAKLTIPEGISVGYRSAMPIIELKLTGDQIHQPEMDKLWSELKDLVNDNMIYEGTIGLAALVGQLLQEQSLSLVVIEQHTAGLMAYQLYDANAPIVESEVISNTKNIDDFIHKLKQEYPTALILSLCDFNEKNNQFKLILTTVEQTYCYRLKYISRRFNKRTEQEIFAAIGLDALRRYLTNQPLIEANIWLEVI